MTWRPPFPLLCVRVVPCIDPPASPEWVPDWADHSGLVFALHAVAVAVTPNAPTLTMIEWLPFMRVTRRELESMTALVSEITKTQFFEADKVKMTSDPTEATCLLLPLLISPHDHEDYRDREWTFPLRGQRVQMRKFRNELAFITHVCELDEHRREVEYTVLREFECQDPIDLTAYKRMVDNDKSYAMCCGRVARRHGDCYTLLMTNTTWAPGARASYIYDANDKGQANDE